MRVLLGLALLVAVTACAASEPTAAGGTASPAVEPSQPASAAPVVTEPNSEQVALLLGALRDVDPGLVIDAERAVRRAKNTCLGVRQGKEDEVAALKAAQRFTSSQVRTLTAKQGQDIVAAVRASFCR